MAMRNSRTPLSIYRFDRSRVLEFIKAARCSVVGKPAWNQPLRPLVEGLKQSEKNGVINHNPVCGEMYMRIPDDSQASSRPGGDPIGIMF